MPVRRLSGAPVLGCQGIAFLDALRALPSTVRSSVDVMRGMLWARLELELCICIDPGQVTSKLCEVKDSDGWSQSARLNFSADGVEELWLALGRTWQGTVADPTSVTVTSCTPKGRKALLSLARLAWCELLATPLDEHGKSKAATVASREAQAASVHAVLERLRSGPGGVKRFARHGFPPWMLRNVLNLGTMHWFPQWVRLDLSGARLVGLVMDRVHATNANFAGADLSHSDLFGSVYPRGNFAGAVLRGARLGELKVIGGNVRDADFSEARLHQASFRDTDCTNARFRNADLSQANLCRAVLTGADLRGADLRGALYDELTRWPRGFEPTAEMRWKGAGASPVSRKQVRAETPRKRLGIESFGKRLEKIAESAKLEKALAMLQSESFRLFAEVTPERLVGIVQSQAHADRLYSCTLASSGAYGCCTADLQPCRGMRGTLCKHLLLLILGLARSGEIDPNVIDRWVRLSRGLKPVLAKELLADTFLRYKGAEAGTIDWRPTETTPEDFYAV